MTQVEIDDIYNDYRERIASVEPANISDFRYIRRLIEEDEIMIEQGLVKKLLFNLRQHKTHMLDRIDEAVQNY